MYAGQWREGKVAIKTFPGLMDDAEVQKSVIAEAQLMKSLRPHSNVVLFQGVCFHESDVYLVFEFVAGGDLWSHLKKQAVDEFKLYHLLHGVASGMLHLSSEGLVHRDLATRNILLTLELEPKIADFVRFGLFFFFSFPFVAFRVCLGWYLLVMKEARQKALPVLFVGKLSVSSICLNLFLLIRLAPEALQESQYSTRSDVWSFGVVIYEVSGCFLAVFNSNLPFCSVFNVKSRTLMFH